MRARFHCLTQIRLSKVSVNTNRGRSIPQRYLLRHMNFTPRRTHFFMILLQLSRRSHFMNQNVTTFYLNRICAIRHVRLNPYPLRPRDSTNRHISFFTVLIHTHSSRRLFTLLIDRTGMIIRGNLIPLKEITRFLGIFSILRQG